MADAAAKPARPLRPKLAASLILRRTRASGDTEILLGRRSGGHVFMPQKYVFPGGRVDRSDGFAPLAGEPKPHVRDTLRRVLSERRARAALAAAIRETAEETGLLVARPGAIANARPEWRPFAEAGALPDAAPLDLVARAITPPGRPRRFDAFFFTADIDAVHGPRDLTGSGELEDLRWVNMEGAHQLDIPIITRFVLSELDAHLKGEQDLVRCARVTRSGPRLDPV
jgi:8-oxo-dGTP pyrophosphatase MutT (NUDIX family)